MGNVAGRIEILPLDSWKNPAHQSRMIEARAHIAAKYFWAYL